MVILVFFLGVGRAWKRPPPQLSTEEGRRIAMVILLFFLGPEGQTSSSLEGTQGQGQGQQTSPFGGGYTKNRPHPRLAQTSFKDKPSTLLPLEAVN